MCLDLLILDQFDQLSEDRNAHFVAGYVLVDIKAIAEALPKLSELDKFVNIFAK